MVGDEAQLYRSLAGRLERIVGRQVSAPPDVIEDACHHAWAKFFNHSEEVRREAALTWLLTTAVRQAWKLDRQERRELSLEAASDRIGELPIRSRLPGPVEQAEIREDIRRLGDLPERQQRLVWLRAAGLSYVEMAAYTGDSVRTVRRQILRATEHMRRLQHETPEREAAMEARQAAPQASRARPRPVLERGLER